MDIEKVYEKRLSDLKVEKEEVVKSIREAQAELQSKQQDLNELVTDRVKIETKIDECKDFLKIIQEEKEKDKPKKP